jgi:peptidase S24-like protein
MHPGGRCVRDSARFVETLEELLRRGHHARFRAGGWSMHPAIRDGDVITVAPLGGSPVRIGDVVLYRQGQGAIAHRVVRVRALAGRLVEVVARGDAADACDAPIGPEQVLGLVVAVERNPRGVLRRSWARCVQGVRSRFSRADQEPERIEI